ncbi:hypothetical protein Mapa_005058 [Marchantia paleacea]|nr:hypothetical protein Mapa_005058 [Marchantia paleacea]
MIMTAHSRRSKVAALSYLWVVLASLGRVRSHSWAACIDWRFYSGVHANNPAAFSDNLGKCYGYARRYDTQRAWGTLDSDYPSRHYRQASVADPIACSNGPTGSEHEGADEQRAKPVSAAYAHRGNIYGPMTIKRRGSALCLRWPAKNHAVPSQEEEFVFIRMIPSRMERPNGRQSEFGKPIARLRFKNCLQEGDPDKWFCGGCFRLPKTVTSGLWTLQWRWMLNQGEYYTSCADVLIRP